MELNAPILMSELYTVADPAPRLSAARVARTPAGAPLPVCTHEAFTDYVCEWRRIDPNGWHFPDEIEVTPTHVFYEDAEWERHADGTFTLTDWAAWQVCPTVQPAPMGD